MEPLPSWGNYGSLSRGLRTDSMKPKPVRFESAWVSFVLTDIQNASWAKGAQRQEVSELF